MAFPSLNAQQELNNRKILEDLQIKKQLLQKGVSPVVTTIPSVPANNSGLGLPQYMQMSQPPSDVILNAPARAAWNQAHTQSFGFFVPQDSAFGNSIIPVLPRFDPPPK
ncbi:SOSS complex subunit C homolog [Lutzomyia longipalpis]|uniref:SOSS complex subunit C homolog n=1 Tax=Lutzomyia longipalpis TaxID=7200 RepID=UPI0024834761|nr:SOSS complex subunit C homolog [Lutzomyia longipalpis]